MHYKFYSTEDFIHDEFFQQWVFGKNEEAKAYWTNFLLLYPTQHKSIAEAREFLLAMDSNSPIAESEVQKIKFNFNAAIDELEKSQRIPEHLIGVIAPHTRLFPKYFYLVAATLLLTLLAVGFLTIQSHYPPRSLDALTMEMKKTPKGKQQHIVLEDGTEVWLNANSVLTYRKNFSGQINREVFLEGEAFFDVAKMEEKPFIVHASGLDIRVLGTIFNVKSYAEDHTVETTLVEGKVSIGSTTESAIKQVTLLPNQQALFRKDSLTIKLDEAVDTENYIAWKNGWMIFDEKPFSDIKETLERWYNVSIVMEDENSLSCAFSAKFKDKTLLEVLEIFKNTESISYRIVGDTVFIDGKLCEY